MAKVSSISDNFDDNSRDTSIWNLYYGTHIDRISETGGVLQCTYTANQTDTNYTVGYQSVNTYSLIGSQMSVKVAAAGSMTSKHEVIFSFSDLTNEIAFYITGNSLQAKNTSTIVKSAAYDVAAHLYLRIIEDSGTIYWETSSDGINWSIFTSLATSSALVTTTAGYVFLIAGPTASDTVSTITQFDDFNIFSSANYQKVVRKIAQSLLVSWHKYSLLGAKTFTIGISTIGGNDVIGANPGAIGSPGNYKYFDESDYVLSLGWERGYNMPQGGINMALAEAVLDNTSGRFTPRYMGGSSEINTAILPMRPTIINAGFNDGADETIVQFSGLVSDQPEINIRNRIAKLKMSDYMMFFENKYLDQQVMFTGQRTDQVLSTLLTQAGMNTAQYDLDYGSNIIPFGVFPAGARFSDIIGQLVEAENGHFYQREDGVFQFENRTRWNTNPYNQISYVINTAQVIDAEAASEDHLVNVVEINANVRTKQQQDIVFRLDVTNPVLIPASTTSQDFFVNFDDPVLALTTPTNGGAVSYFVANSASDGSGTDMTSSVSMILKASFANAAKFALSNSSTSDVYLTSVVISGRTAKVTSNLYLRAKDGSSVTAYQEHSLMIDNDFIGNQTWAESFAQMLLSDYSDPTKIQRLTIRAIPNLTLGTYISWQGRYWRIFDIKTTLDPSAGFIQELLLLQRTMVSYFRIGISTIGGTDKIAP